MQTVADEMSSVFKKCLIVAHNLESIDAMQDPIPVGNPETRRYLFSILTSFLSERACHLWRGSRGLVEGKMPETAQTFVRRSCRVTDFLC